MSIFGTPEERKRRQQEQEAAIAEAKQKMKEKLLSLWNMTRQLPAPIQAALIGILGIIIGNMMGRNTSAAQLRDAQNASAAQFHRDRLTQNL